MGRDWIETEWVDKHDIERTLYQVKAEIIDGVDRVLLQCALILEREIKKQIKEMKLVDTGYLRMNWTSFVEGKLGARYGVVATNTEYAPALNFGTKNEDGSTRIKAYKFIEIAWRNVKYKIIEKFERDMARLAGDSFV